MVAGPEFEPTMRHSFQGVRRTIGGNIADLRRVGKAVEVSRYQASSLISLSVQSRWRQFGAFFMSRVLRKNIFEYQRFSSASGE
jgi:hypothetical protein